MVTFPTPEGRNRIVGAIRTAQARTSSEVSCVLLLRVSSWHDVSLGWAAAASLLVPMLLVPLGFDASWVPGIADSWEAVQLSARDPTIARTLGAYGVVQAAVFVLVFLVTSIPAIQRLVTPRMVRRARVRRTAIQALQVHDLAAVLDQPRLLILVALQERCIEIVANFALCEKVDKAVWGEVVEDLALAFRDGRHIEGLEAALGRVGDLLAEALPTARFDQVSPVKPSIGV